jgi:hypothetical protein
MTIPSEARARAEAALKEHRLCKSAKQMHAHRRTAHLPHCRACEIHDLWPCPTAALAGDVIALCNKLDEVTKPPTAMRR